MGAQRRLWKSGLAVGVLVVAPLVAWGQSGAGPADPLPSSPAAPPDAQSQPPAVNGAAEPPRGPSEADSSAASARGPFSIFSSADVGHLPYRADYRAAWFPDEQVKGQGTDLGFVRQDLTLSCPIWQDSCDEWSMSAHVGNDLFHTGAVFPDTDQPFPDELWNVRLGTTYRRLFDNGWVAGGTVSVGSASDKPFDGVSEMTAGVNGFLRIPQGENNAWLFTVSYSTNSELPIPIPGVAFLWQPSDQLRMNIGLPFEVLYRPTDDLTLDVSYMLLTSVHARATYRVLPALRIYCGYDYNNESWLPADRPDERERLFYYDQQLTAGVQYAVGRCATLDFAGGYAFDRYYFEGDSFSDRNQNRIDVGDGPFLSANFRVRW